MVEARPPRRVAIILEPGYHEAVHEPRPRSSSLAELACPNSGTGCQDGTHGSHAQNGSPSHGVSLPRGVELSVQDGPAHHGAQRNSRPPKELSGRTIRGEGPSL